jgi:hypothetical protein
VGAEGGARPLSVSTSAFEYMSETRQIGQVRAFMARLPQALSG